MSLRHSLLAVLCRKPKTGYELSKDFESSTGFFWSATHQQIYKQLGELERRGWVRFREVRQIQKPDKKIYAITRDGRTELRRWACAESAPASSKDEFLVKLFVGDLVPPGGLLEDLLRQRARHLERLERYRQIEAEHFLGPGPKPGRRRFQYLTLKRGLMFEISWLKWCDEAERALRAEEPGA